MDAAAGKMPPEDRPNLKQNNNKGGKEAEDNNAQRATKQSRGEYCSAGVTVIIECNRANK